MGVFSPVQTSFAGGELSPRLGGRVDADLYKIGLARCENFEPLAHGPLLMRAGSEQIAALGADPRVRLIRFRMTDAQDYLLVLTAGQARIYSLATGLLQLVAKSELLANGAFSLGATSWTAGPGVSFPAGQCVIPGYSAGANSLSQKLTVAQDGVLTLKVDVKAKYTDLGSLPGGRFRVRVGNAPGGAEHLDVHFDDVNHDALVGVHEWPTAAPVPAGDRYVTFTTEANGANECRVTIDDASVTIDRGDMGLDYIETPWSADQLAAVQFAPETGKNRMLFVHPNVPPWFLNYQAADSWDFGTIQFAGTPADWAGLNWPAVVEVSNGRVYWGGTPADRNRFRASKAGEPFDLTLASGPGSPATVLPGDGMDFKLAAKGAIRWMRGNRTLLVGTDLEEHSITGSKGYPLNDDIQVRRESAYGSAAVQGVDAGASALYVSGDRRKIRALQYDLQTSGWDSKDVTFTAEHVTKPLLKELHFAWKPDGMIVGVLDDGTLGCCTFEPGEKVVAWWRVGLASGAVRSAAVSQGPAGAYLWVAVERAGAVYLERLPLSEVPGARYLDASVAGVVAGGEFAGLGHLEGRTVSVLVNGAVAGELDVEGGKVALDAPDGTPVVAGLSYRAIAMTLPREGGSPRGSAQGAKRRNVRVRLRLNNSALPIVDGDRAAPTRTPETPMGEREPLTTGDVEVSLLGWGDGSLTIEQDLPFRTEILGVFTNTAVNDV